MSITDLTGTTWLIDEVPTIPSSMRMYRVDFSSDDYTEGAGINIGVLPPLLDGIMYVSNSANRAVYSISGGWADEAYRTITFTGGTDATNADLIAWIQANAEQVVKYINKVQYVRNGQLDTLIDLTADTVTASDMLSGVTAHDASGAVVTGTLADGDSLEYGVSTQPLVGTARVGATEI